MTGSADRSPRPAPRPGSAGFAETVRDEFARVRGRTVGACAACGRPIFFGSENVSRFKGSVVHVRCPGVHTSWPLTARDGHGEGD